eukprot:TRINITY_DN3264_c0_g1_i5.p1 TRINITY_DN3264_c0_g1~~TRINITY_DN3264_c0_g1_i5.p1  ORF type:complete len:184 (-),score=76.71 TRINITY_DN3264_c0_g1_i5:113-664(-)
MLYDSHIKAEEPEEDSKAELKEMIYGDLVDASPVINQAPQAEPDAERRDDWMKEPSINFNQDDNVFDQKEEDIFKEEGFDDLLGIEVDEVDNGEGKKKKKKKKKGKEQETEKAELIEQNDEKEKKISIDELLYANNLIDYLEAAKGLTKEKNLKNPRLYDQNQDIVSRKKQLPFDPALLYLEI